MKRLWILGLLVLVLVALPVVAACGGDETQSTTTAAPATSSTAAASTTTAGGTATTAGGTATTAAATPTTGGKPVTLYVGGTFALTGAYAEDCAAVLAGYQDYIKWVNDNKMLAPWYTDKKIPANITFEVLWGDDGLAADKAVSIYEDQKSKGMLVTRVSGSPEGMALKDMLIKDHIGATTQSGSPAYFQPLSNIFQYGPIYTDQMAAAAKWFMDNWKDTSRKPRVAYLTADAALGRGIDIPEMKAYLEKLGYEFVGAQFVPLVPTAPPTTQLAWLKDNKVDLTLGVMVNPGAQPTIKEAVRLGMGVGQAYPITFVFGSPGHLQIMVPDLGETANGVVVAGDVCAQDADNDGVKFCNLLQDTYRKDKKNTNVMYLVGFTEAMTQVEALRLASLQVDPSKLTPQDVLEKGFEQIKDLDFKGIHTTAFTYGAGDRIGPDSVRLQQVQSGKIVDLGGNYPMLMILPAAKK
jgi:hypothetical protein